MSSFYNRFADDTAGHNDRSLDRLWISPDLWRCHNRLNLQDYVSLVRRISRATVTLWTGRLARKDLHSSSVVRGGGGGGGEGI